MASIDIKELRKTIKEELKKDRYEHSQGVAYTAASLAMRYDPMMVEKALIAGLLHDCAKCYEKDKLLEYCKKNKLLFDRPELCTPALLHSKAGAKLAEQKYQIKDADIISAVCWHTTGRPNMTVLEKIIYISDYIEPNRDKIDPQEMAMIRSAAFEDLDLAVYYISRDTIRYLESTNATMDDEAYPVYDYYRKMVVQKYPERI